MNLNFVFLFQSVMVFTVLIWENDFSHSIFRTLDSIGQIETKIFFTVKSIPRFFSQPNRDQDFFHSQIGTKVSRPINDKKLPNQGVFPKTFHSKMRTNFFWKKSTLTARTGRTGQNITQYRFYIHHIYKFEIKVRFLLSFCYHH